MQEWETIRKRASVDNRHKAYREKRRQKGLTVSGAKKDAEYYRNRRRIKTFIAIDGEGYDKPGTNEHLYTLLGASDESSVFDANGLSTADCFSYLFDLKRRNPNSIFVAFSFGYDFNMMLRDLSWEDVGKLAKKSRVYVTLNDVRYGILYRARKVITISREPRNGSKRTSVTIYDTFGFFQSSFVRAMVDMGVLETSSDDFDLLTSMKAQRGAFTEDEIETIKYYNQIECKYLVLAMNKFRDGFDNLDLHLSQWHGAGAIASAIYRKKNIKEHLINAPEDVPVMYAYFGGRIEANIVGHIDNAYSHDIRSAYPAALVDLPSLQNGVWIRGRDFDNPVSLYRVEWDIKPIPRFGPLPYRRDTGSVIYPFNGSGWYWRDEALAAIRHFGAENVRITDAWNCAGIDLASRPFEWVAELYNQRRELADAGMTAEQKALKLGINSLYGKLAQSLGGNDGKPPAYQNYIYAGLITSITRARLLDAMMSDPDNIVACATDGIYTRFNPLPVDIGKGLGQWESEELSEFFILQPGVYQYKENGKIVTRTRGMSERDIDFDVIRREWDSGNPTHMVVRFDSTRFVGYRIAYAQNKPDEWRRWITSSRSFSMMTRRKMPPILQHAYGPKKRYRWIVLDPPLVDSDCESMPYVVNVASESHEQTIESNEQIDGISYDAW